MVLQTALVTGAGRGIGRGLALALADAGYRLALLGRTPGPLEEVAGLTGGVAVPVELTDGAAVRDAVRRAERELGGLGLVVNNAGVVEHREVAFADDDVEDAWRVVETNVRGPMLVTHAALPGMLARGEGRIANLASGAGYRPSRAYTGYGVSKGALGRLTTLVDAQYRAAGIRTLDLAPGVVRTDMTAGMPVHDGRTEWTPIEEVAALLLAFAAGELDELSGRFVRAGADTVASLRAAAARIAAADARRLRVPDYGADDPIAD